MAKRKRKRKEKNQKIHMKNFYEVPECYGLWDSLVVGQNQSQPLNLSIVVV